MTAWATAMVASGVCPECLDVISSRSGKCRGCNANYPQYMKRNSDEDVPKGDGRSYGGVHWGFGFCGDGYGEVGKMNNESIDGLVTSQVQRILNFVRAFDDFGPYTATATVVVAAGLFAELLDGSLETEMLLRTKMLDVFREAVLDDINKTKES